jgi:hypothetical protein
MHWLCRDTMAAMPRCPMFYFLGALAGLALWLIEAPPPFPFLGLTALASGGLGLLLSLVYIASFERRQWRSMLVSVRRATRAMGRALDRLDAPPMRASEIRALRAKSSAVVRAPKAARA